MGKRLDTNDIKMATCAYDTSSSFESSYSSSFSSSSSSSSSRSSSVDKMAASSELDELLYKAMNMSSTDKARMFREFYLPYHIALTGNYYPRHKITGMERGTCHVSYLARPYYSYRVPSCYRGFSKYVYIRKK